MENFVDVEFFQNKCSVLVTHFYFLYSLCGGMYYEKYVRFRFKLFLIFYSCVAYLFCTIPQLKIFVTHSKFEYVYIALGYTVYLLSAILRTYALYSKRKSFHRLFDLVNEYEDKPAPVIDLKYDSCDLNETNILNVCVKIYITNIAGLLFIYLAKLSAQLFKLYHNTAIIVNNEWEFFVSFFCENCTTLPSYLVALTLSFIFVMPFVVSWNGSLLLLMTLSIHLKNRAIVLKNNLRYYSESALEKFQQYDVLEEQELNNTHPSDFKLRDIRERRETLVQEYMANVYRWIDIHRRIVECSMEYQNCTSGIVEFEVTFASLYLIVSWFFFQNLTLDFVQSILLIPLYLVVVFGMLLFFCKIGNMLKETTDMISDAVYSTPWFHLPAKEQKIILNFLTLSQHGQELRIFGAFTLNLELFPAILDQAYSYVQIMRLLVSRSGK